MTQRTYPSAAAFKQALEQRLRAASGNGSQFGRRRQLLVFDRFLARIVAAFGDSVTLKGGLVLELRIERARTTKDVDLRLVGGSHNLLARLQQCSRQDLGDFMTFEVAPDQNNPEIQNQAMQYDGLRFRTECRLAGKLYGHPFGVDIAFGDPLVGEVEIVEAPDHLSFAGVKPPKLQLYPIETHIAEKLHAYTIPRDRPNSRVKNLPDIALLAGTRTISSVALRAALHSTFTFRKTHPLPSALPEPPPAWALPYAAMAQEDQLAWVSLAKVTATARAFMDPVLAGSSVSTWDPATWNWAP